MANGPSNAKRQRPDETRDGDLYFEDGSVILSAKDTDGDQVYFRVHKSVLTKQSAVFKDMFSVPSPSEIELYDNLPLVHLHDNVDELKKFLQAMYDPSFLPFRRLQADTPELVAGPLKLATKYQADSLRQRIISHLETDWPITLDAWDMAYVAATPEPDMTDETADSQLFDDESDPPPKVLLLDPVAFIPLARECDLPGIVATVFYSLCRNSTSRPEGLSRMTPEDLKLLMLGRERMTSFICGPGADELDIHSWVVDRDMKDLCERGIVCTEKGCRYPVLMAWLVILQDVMRYGDPLATFLTEARKLEKFVNNHNGENDYYSYTGDHREEMCIDCKSRLSIGLFGLRQTLFDKLPSFFAL